MTRSKKTRLAAAAAVALLVAGAAALGVSQRADAVTANESAYTIMYIREDGFRNWDFHCNGTGCITRTNVDWPMVLLFYNNAEINKVKDNILEPRYDQGSTCASAQYARLNDGAGFNWDGDSGKKTTCCPGAGWPFPSTADHIRFYAAGRAVHDRMYNTSWGYWIIASAHQDHNEPQCTTAASWFGYTETAEGNLYNYWTGNLGRPGWRNQQFWYNAQNNDQGNHYVRSNGYASVFWVA
jgi:hypothetical protein